MRNESETEALQVQRAAVETKFLRLQTDLHAVLDANEEITTENKNKDGRIAEYERDFKVMHARNHMDMEQRLHERQYLIDDLEHELDVAQTSLRRAELEKERSRTLEADNVSLREACARIREQISNTGAQHALEVHKMNADMRQRRIQLENILRKELMTRDVSLQNNAFSKLAESKKQALLANSKIKDELLMLRMGLGSLSDRYEKDNRSITDAKHRLDDLDRKSAELATHVKELSELKHIKQESITRVKEEIQAFERDKAEMDAALQSLETPEQLQVSAEKLDVLYDSEMRSIALWLERRRLLGLLRKELDIMTKLDKTALGTTSASTAKTPKSRGEDVPLKRSIDLPAILAKDDTLKEAMRALIGCDSVFVDGYDANPNDNIAGWIAAQVLTIWSTTREQWELAATSNAMNLAMPSLLLTGRSMKSQNDEASRSDPQQSVPNYLSTRPTTAGTDRSNISAGIGLEMTETDINELLSRYDEDTFVPTEEDYHPEEDANDMPRSSGIRSRRESLSASDFDRRPSHPSHPASPSPETLRLVGGPFEQSKTSVTAAPQVVESSPVRSKNTPKDKLLEPEKFFRLSSDPNKDVEPPISISQLVIAPSYSTSALTQAGEKGEMMHKAQSMGALLMTSEPASSPSRGNDSAPSKGQSAASDPLSRKALKYTDRKRPGW